MGADVLVAELPAGNNNKIGLVTLNAPSALNALSQSMIDQLLLQLSRWRDQRDMVAVVMASSSDKAFCAGGDVRAVRDAAVAGNRSAVAQFFTSEYQLDYLLHCYPKPLICWANGIVMGGGIGLMAGASFRVVTDTSALAMPEVAIGLYPDVAASWLLPRLPVGLGLFMGLTGCRLNAADAIYTGLANRFIDHAFYDNVIESLQQAEWQGAQPHEVVYGVMATYQEKSAGWLPYSKVREHRDLLAGVMDQPSLTATMSALARLPDSDEWLMAASKGVHSGSPLSAAISYWQWHRARHLSLKEALQSELVLSVNTVMHGDFCEGVRALLVDKDRQPQWRYERVDQIDEQVLEQLFHSPWTENPLHNLNSQ